jgi:hypothetical protein
MIIRQVTTSFVMKTRLCRASKNIIGEKEEKYNIDKTA